MDLLNRPTLRPADTAAATARLLARDAVRVLPEDGLFKRLMEDRPLRVKLGLDPTAPDVHLGHAVVLQKARDFQDLGHTVVLIIGDFTARIGDPTGRNATRPKLDDKQIDAAAETFADQAFRILDPARTELRRNSEWLNMSAAEMLELASGTTLAQLLHRDDFAKRHADGNPITMQEMLYPILQGFDSAAIRADVELGGTDQTFNLALARDIQSHHGVPQQVSMTMPLLRGTDGIKKMSKSLGNVIGLTDSPEDIFGKTMSIPDNLMGEWADLLFGCELPEDLAPMDRKRLLAASLAERFCGSGAGIVGSDAFDALHVRHEVPSDAPEHSLGGDTSIHLPALISDAFGDSRGAARRALAAGGVKLDGQAVPKDTLDMPTGELRGRVLALGKRRFFRLV